MRDDIAVDDGDIDADLECNNLGIDNLILDHDEHGHVELDYYGVVFEHVHIEHKRVFHVHHYNQLKLHHNQLINDDKHKHVEFFKHEHIKLVFDLYPDQLLFVDGNYHLHLYHKLELHHDLRVFGVKHVLFHNNNHEPWSGGDPRIDYAIDYDGGKTV